MMQYWQQQWQHNYIYRYNSNVSKVEISFFAIIAESANNFESQHRYWYLSQEYMHANGSNNLILMNTPINLFSLIQLLCGPLNIWFFFLHFQF